MQRPRQRRLLRAPRRGRAGGHHRLLVPPQQALDAGQRLDLAQLLAELLVWVYVWLGIHAFGGSIDHQSDLHPERRFDPRIR